MIHYLKADIFKIYKEHRLTLSLGILAALSFLSVLLLLGSDSYTNSLLQLLTQFITLFFIVPANLFFGEDFSNRTINNTLIKQQDRKTIFAYKVIATILFDLFYVLLSYCLSSTTGNLLGENIDFLFIFQSFFKQIPLFITISLLSILLFISLKKVNHAYLAFILTVLLFDNMTHLITSNLLHVNLPSDFFLFLSLQKGTAISHTSLTISLIFIGLYIISSYLSFNHKDFK